MLLPFDRRQKKTWARLPRKLSNDARVPRRAEGSHREGVARKTVDTAAHRASLSAFSRPLLFSAPASACAHVQFQESGERVWSRCTDTFFKSSFCLWGVPLLRLNGAYAVRRYPVWLLFLANTGVLTVRVVTRLYGLPVWCVPRFISCGSPSRGRFPRAALRTWISDDACCAICARPTAGLEGSASIS